MKIALLNDIHAGARSDNETVLGEQRKFFETIFWPYVNQHKIKDIFILGDLFDRRKYINFKTLHEWNDFFYDQAVDPIRLYVSTGNHDVYHKNTNTVNSPRLLIHEFHRLFESKPTEVVFDGQYVGVLPWITEDNHKECIEFIQKTTCPVLFGHFDINGFDMGNGMECTFGLEPKIFNKFDLVVSGHYHKRSQKGNITYLGTQYQMDWGDYGQIKGFHVYDTEKRALEFVPNPSQLFVKLHYRDDGKTPDPDLPDLRGKFVKLYVVTKHDPVRFDNFYNRIVEMKPEDLSVIEADLETEELSEQDGPIELKSTVDLLREYCQTLKDVQDKLKNDTEDLLVNIYTETRQRV